VASPVIGGVNSLGLVQECTKRPPKTSTNSKSFKKKLQKNFNQNTKKQIALLEGYPKSSKRASKTQAIELKMLQ